MTDIEIVNAALGNLGVARISAIDDTTPDGSTIKGIYPTTRDALLQVRPWTFATTRAQLTKDAGVPAFGYAYQYQLPNNMLDVIRCWTGTGVPLERWKRELMFVLTDASPNVFAEMKVRVSEGAFPPLFNRALIAQLTADLAVPLTENRTTADSWEAKAESRLVVASVTDGKQGISEAPYLPAMPGRRSTGRSGGRF